MKGDFQIGDRVLIRNTNRPGTVIEIDDKHGRKIYTILTNYGSIPTRTFSELQMLMPENVNAVIKSLINEFASNLARSEGFVVERWDAYADMFDVGALSNDERLVLWDRMLENVPEFVKWVEMFRVRLEHAK